jgi:hypothetical protein
MSLQNCSHELEKAKFQAGDSVKPGPSFRRGAGNQKDSVQNANYEFSISIRDP